MAEGPDEWPMAMATTDGLRADLVTTTFDGRFERYELQPQRVNTYTAGESYGMLHRYGADGRRATSEIDTVELELVTYGFDGAEKRRIRRRLDGDPS